MTMLDIALDYARGGALVMPLHSPAPDLPGGCTCRGRTCAKPAKHSRTMNGLNDATSDPETVRRWWEMWPTANVGIRPHAGQVVLDVDPRHQGGEHLRQWQEQYGPLPPTRMARTGGGGWHGWYAMPGEVVGALVVGVDVKACTGFLVAPPSVHVSGSTYEWVNTGPIAEAPAHLRRALARPPLPMPRRGVKATPAVVAGLVRVVSSAEEGNRNRSLHWACLRGAEHGVELAVLVDAAMANGLSRREAEATARSAQRTIGGAA